MTPTYLHLLDNKEYKLYCHFPRWSARVEWILPPLFHGQHPMIPFDDHFNVKGYLYTDTQSESPALTLEGN